MERFGEKDMNDFITYKGRVAVNMDLVTDFSVISPNKSQMNFRIFFAIPAQSDFGEPLGVFWHFEKDGVECGKIFAWISAKYATEISYDWGRE